MVLRKAGRLLLVLIAIMLLAPWPVAYAYEQSNSAVAAGLIEGGSFYTFSLPRDSADLSPQFYLTAD